MQELHSRKLSKTLVYEINVQCIHQDIQDGGEGPLDVFTFQETKELDGSSFQPLVVDLCPVESYLKMWFRDTW